MDAKKIVEELPAIIRALGMHIIIYCQTAVLLLLFENNDTIVKNSKRTALKNIRFFKQLILLPAVFF